MSEMLISQLIAIFQIVLIDLVLAGDNAIVVGLAVAGLPQEMRRKAILFGMGGAVVLRILFSIIALKLLQVLGLTLAGGLLLAWVSWKLYRDLRSEAAHNDASGIKLPTKTAMSAALSILAADVSMSLDNALAVAGAARDHIEILIAGLILSVGLMAVAAEWVARLIMKYRWVAWVGLAVVAYVAGDMIYRGATEVYGAM